MNTKKLLSKENILGTLFLLGAVICLIRSVILSFSIDIWYDELFTMEFAARKTSDLISLTARDVHPPLYYMIVRFFILAGQALGFVGKEAGELAPEILAKLVSILPFVILIIYAMTTVRKHFGFLSTGLFSFAIVAMPQLPEYTTEIRMYSWVILFVTAALLHGMNLLRRFEKGNEQGWDVADGLALWLYSTAAAYTHYYGAFCIGIIYGILILWMLVSYVKVMKGKTVKTGEGASSNNPSDAARTVSFKAFAVAIVCANLTVISYIPWISVVLSQVSQVKASYWIQPVGIRSLGSCVKYLFKGYFANDTLAVVVAVLLFVLVLFLFADTVKRAVLEKDKTALYTLFAFSILPLLVFAGLLASFLIRPVFVNRYMLPAYGTFWLSISIMTAGVLSKEKGLLPQKAGILLAAVMMLVMGIVGAVDFKAFIGNEEYRKVNMEKTLSLFEEISSDTIIVSNFNQVQGLLSYYLNRNGEDHRVYLYMEEPEPLIYETVPNLETIYDPIDLKNYLDSGKTVLFLGSFNSREVLLEEWNDTMGIRSDNKGSYLMERYWFDVFKLRR